MGKNRLPFILRGWISQGGNQVTETQGRSSLDLTVDVSPLI